MSLHIAHATATFAELGIAMSVALLAKIIIPFPLADSGTRETTRNRLRSEGNTAVLFYNAFCKLVDFVNYWSPKIPAICFFMSTASLLGMAFCPSPSPRAEFWMFALSVFSFSVIALNVYFLKATFSKNHETPIIEPVE